MTRPAWPTLLANDNLRFCFLKYTKPAHEHHLQVLPARPSLYRDGYSAYLFLGSLEYEIFSPLIAGFYTDEFVKEIERRYLLVFGKSWSETYNREPNAESFIAWMTSWGRPRKWRRFLGPMNAWQYGDDWERLIQEKQHKFALNQPEEIVKSAEKLFDAIRNADYDKPYMVRQLDYTAARWADEWAEWICKTFRDNPVMSVELGEVFRGENSLPTVPYKLTLKDGKLLEGNLPFRYEPLSEHWQPRVGLDWHLR